MSKGALEGDKVLTQGMPEYAGAYTTEWPDHKTWQGPASGHVVFNETYVDLSAYELDDLTFFPINALLQDPGIYSLTGQEPVQVLDIVCTEQLSIAEVVADMAENNVPGMFESTMDFTQIIWGQYRTFLPQTDFVSGTLYLPANGALFGSGSPTTASKLYCYRIIICALATEGLALTIPASRFVITGIVAKEKELAFMMRQKRSYELAQ